MPNLTTLLLKVPRNQEVTPEAAKTFLSALTQINAVSFFQKLFGIKPPALALEIASVNQQIQFLITCDAEIIPFVETQIQAAYPLVIIEKTTDPLENQNLEARSLNLAKGNYYPLGTYDKFTDIDPLSSVLSVLSKVEPTEIAMVQVAIESTSSRWQTLGANFAEYGTKNEDGTYQPRSDKNIILEKFLTRVLRPR